MRVDISRLLRALSGAGNTNFAHDGMILRPRTERNVTEPRVRPSVARRAAGSRRGRRLLLGTLLLVASHATGVGAARAARPAGPPAAAPGSADAATFAVGRLTLHRCESAAAWCGVLPRPLDPGGVTAGTVPVYFEYYPHTQPGPPTGTLVATEGGPGYPATGSREEYLALFAPLRRDHDVLLMDNRGTGHSGAIDCPRLQNAPRLTEANIGECGRSLGPAAALYRTALATDDLAALLAALAARSIDLYGDSYGTYFAQVFALRHGGALRSLVLDGAYPLEGPDYPWYPHYAPAMRDKFNLACERSAACRAIAGSSLAHIAPALASLRARPVPARVRYGDGRLVRFMADATQLAIVMYAGAPAYASVRELDAAARAFENGDRLPLLRLMAETRAAVDSRDATRSPLMFSSGLAAAVFCEDPPQIFDMTLPPPQRLTERDRIIARRRLEAPDTYAPFTIDEYRRMPLDYAFIDECVRWPARPRTPSATAPVPPDARYPDVPVLVVSGELDNMTSAADGAAAAAHFPHSHHLIIANSFHVNALPHARSDCGAILVRRFIASLATGDERCAAAVPAVRLVPRFARRIEELPASEALAGNEAAEHELRAVSAALLAGEDLIVRAVEAGPGAGVGLRGGTYTVRSAAGGYHLELRAVRWTEDLAIDGDIDSPARSGVVHARFTLQGPTVHGTLELEWPEGVAVPRASARGRLDGRTVVASAPAP
jgi:pimeloyl-ACP methyl ester carboxylesterase